MIRSLLAIVSFFVFSFFANAQEFSSVEKTKDNNYKIEVVFEEIKDVNIANNIISELKKIDQVIDVELFYPSTKNGYIFIKQPIDAKVVIEKLETIGVILNQKSFKN